MLLEAGDIAILPHGDAHTTRGIDTPAGARTTANLLARHNAAILVKSNGFSDTELVCGRLWFELAHENLIFATLPAGHRGPYPGSMTDARTTGPVADDDPRRA